MGTLLNRGLTGFKKVAKQREQQFQSRFVYLRDDGERARLKFLTDAEDFGYGVFHRPFINNKLSDPIICLDDPSNPRPDDLGTDVCRLCAQTPPDKSSRLMFFAQV